MSEAHKEGSRAGPAQGAAKAPHERVAPQGEEGGNESALQAMVTEPAKLMRIGTMLRELQQEVHHAEVDQAGLERLGDVHTRAIEGLRDVISHELRDELDELSPPLPTEHAPTESEVRLAQAQLLGWLEGLFQGIQAAVASQQQAARQQLEQMRQQRALSPGERSREHGAGQYL